MNTHAPEQETNELIDAGARTWWQGDVADAHWFRTFSPGDYAPESAIACRDSSTLRCTDERVDGLVVLTQTCDIRKPSAKRPYVQVSPLVHLEGTDASFARKGRLLNFVPVPGLGDQFFADVDRIMTIGKSFLMVWNRTSGCRDDRERREFGRRVARVNQRFAFPDDLQASISEMVKLIKKRYPKESVEGKALESIEEIRVTAEPSWDSAEIKVFLTFALTNEEVAPEITGEQWADLVQKWIGLCTPTGVIKSVEGTLLPLDRITAREYLDSARLELDYVSAS
jgi:hypothetical protein